MNNHPFESNNIIFSPSHIFGATSGYTTIKESQGIRENARSFYFDEVSTYFSVVGAQLTLLSDELAKIRNEIKQNQYKNIFVRNLPLTRIKIKEHLSLVVEEDDNGVTVSSPDLDIFGNGETQFDALRDFSESLEELYFDLKDEKPENLGYYPTIIKDFLNEVVVDKDATKGKRSKKGI